jgi:NADH:ubiquinone oxidoreductase subunit 2 (subunit N)
MEFFKRLEKPLFTDDWSSPSSLMIWAAPLHWWLEQPLFTDDRNSPSSLMIGAAPLHWWFPGVMEGLRWENCALFITVQKAAPLILISYLIETNAFTLRIILISTIVGSIGELNQTSIRNILTYSSINDTGWIVIALTTSENLLIVYFIIYSILALTVVSAIKISGTSCINQTIITIKEAALIKLIIFTSLLSLGGLHPFLGFLLK